MLHQLIQLAEFEGGDYQFLCGSGFVRLTMVIQKTLQLSQTENGDEVHQPLRRSQLRLLRFAAGLQDLMALTIKDTQPLLCLRLHTHFA
jgi:hypothetical protein